MIKVFAAVLIALGITLNAFGEHYLSLDPYQKSLIFKASFYLIISCLGCFVMTSFADKLLLTGGIIFSVTLILIVFTGIKVFGAITPIGGVLMIVAWLIEAWFRFKVISS